MSTEKKSEHRRLTGVVVSTKMDKTAVVRIERTVLHSKYLKRYTVSKKYKAHDENNSAKVGDKVLIEETSPISKDKRWRIVNAK